MITYQSCPFETSAFLLGAPLGKWMESSPWTGADESFSVTCRSPKSSDWYLFRSKLLGILPGVTGLRGAGTNSILLESSSGLIELPSEHHKRPVTKGPSQKARHKRPVP